MQQLRAHFGPQAVRADQRRAFIARAAFAHDHDPLARLLEAGDLDRGRQADPRMAAHRVEDGLVQVRAMDHGIGIVEAGAKTGAQRNARHFLAGEAVAHDQVVGKHGARVDRLGQAQKLEHAEHVRSELDAGTDFAEIRRRLEHMYAKPLARERQRDRQTADATAGHEYGQVGFRHFSSPCVSAIIIASDAASSRGTPPIPQANNASKPSNGSKRSLR